MPPESIMEGRLSPATDIFRQVSRELVETAANPPPPPPALREPAIRHPSSRLRSFGVLMWQFVAAARPWPGMSPSQIIQAVCVRKERLRFPPVGVPEPYRKLGDRCLSYDYTARPTAHELVEVMEGLGTCLRQGFR